MPSTLRKSSALAFSISLAVGYLFLANPAPVLPGSKSPGRGSGGPATQRAGAGGLFERSADASGEDRPLLTRPMTRPAAAGGIDSFDFGVTEGYVEPQVTEDLITLRGPYERRLLMSSSKSITFIYGGRRTTPEAKPEQPPAYPAPVLPRSKSARPAEGQLWYSSVGAFVRRDGARPSDRPQRPFTQLFESSTTRPAVQFAFFVNPFAHDPAHVIDIELDLPSVSFIALSEPDGNPITLSPPILRRLTSKWSSTWWDWLNPFHEFGISVPELTPDTPFHLFASEPRPVDSPRFIRFEIASPPLFDR